MDLHSQHITHNFNINIYYIFFYHYALVLTLSHHCTRFSLLKAVSVYHYALTFFSVIITFFSQCQPLFFHSYTFFHLIMLSFFFSCHHIFFQSQLHYSTTFFSLCSHYALTHLSFIFSVFSYLSQGGPLQIFHFCNFNINLFKYLFFYIIIHYINEK